jgi:hypothetical protein
MRETWCQLKVPITALIRIDGEDSGAAKGLSRVLLGGRSNNFRRMNGIRAELMVNPAMLKMLNTTLCNVGMSLPVTPPRWLHKLVDIGDT